MKRLKDLVGRELKWIQPQVTRREFELRDGEEVVATLSFRSTFGSLATAQTAEGSWTFKRVGFWQTHVTICPAGSTDEIGAFRNNTWSAGGTLELPKGPAYRANSNMWATRYGFQDAAGEPLIQFTKIGGVFHRSSMVVVSPAAADLAEMPWMVALGWYLAIKMQDDSAGAAAAAAAAG